MSTKQLLQRGYRNWSDFYFDLMIKSRNGPEGPWDMFKELAMPQRKECLCYLADQAYYEQEQAAVEALKIIVVIL